MSLSASEEEGTMSDHACYEVQLDLIEYLYDGLEPARRAEVEAALAGCERCRAELQGFREVMGALDAGAPASLGFADEAALGPVLAHAIEQASAGLRSPAAAAPAASAASAANAMLAEPGSAGSRSAWMRWAGAAAAALLLLGLGGLAGRISAPRAALAEGSLAGPERAELAGQLAALHGQLDARGQATLRGVERRLGSGTALEGALDRLHRAEGLLASGQPAGAAALASEALASAGPLTAAARSLQARAALAGAEQAVERGAYTEAAGQLAAALAVEGGLGEDEQRIARAMQAELAEGARSGFAPQDLARRARSADPAGLVELVSSYPASPLASRAFDQVAERALAEEDQAEIQAVRRRARVQQELIRLEALSRQRPDLTSYIRLRTARLLAEAGRETDALREYHRTSREAGGRLAEQARREASAVKQELYEKLKGELSTIITLQHRLSRKIRETGATTTDDH